MSKRSKHVPRSRMASDRLSSNFEDNFAIPSGLTVATVLLFLLLWVSAAMSTDYDHSTEIKWLALGAFILVLLVWIVALIWTGKNWEQERNAILDANEKDFQRSLLLTQTLQQLFKENSTNFPVVEDVVAGNWRPFRVEYFVSQALRGQLEGSLKIHFGNGWFGSRNADGQFSGTLAGNGLPNLIDSSTIVFMTDGLRTLRVLIPSPSFTKELFARMLKSWRLSHGEGSHVDNALKELGMQDEYLVAPITHPQMVDRLAALCELPLDQRPVVTIKGDEIQAGVAVCAALEFTGVEERVFFPSGFFKKLLSGIQQQLSLEPKAALTAKEVIG